MLLDLLGINKVIKQIKCKLQKLENNTSSSGNFIPLTGTEEGKPVTGPILFSYPDDGYNYGELSLDRLSDTICIVKSDDGSKYDGNNEYYYLTKAGGFIRKSNNSLYIVEMSEDGLFSNTDFSASNPENKLIYAQRAYVDKANSYSIDEIKTGGTWIDGKPIYRKVVEFTLNDGTYILDLTGYNIDNYFKSKATLIDDNGELINEFISFTQNNVSQFYSRKVFQNTLEIMCISTTLSTGDTTFFNIGTYGAVTLEYTKTTD